MKYIISESQVSSFNPESIADIMYKMLNLFYPKNYKFLDESNPMSPTYDVISKEHDGDELLFFFKIKKKEIVIGIDFLEKLFEVSGLPIFDYTEVKTNKRGMFDEAVKIFAKKYYGWDIIKTHFHWYT